MSVGKYLVMGIAIYVCYTMWAILLKLLGVCLMVAFGTYICHRLYPQVLRRYVGDVCLLVEKGAEYFKEDLVELVLQEENGVVVRQLTPWLPYVGRFHAALIHGPNDKDIKALMNNSDPAYRTILSVFGDFVPGLINNPTDAPYFLHSGKEAIAQRQTLIKYIQNTDKLNQIFTECVSEFTRLFSREGYWSANNEILKIVYKVVGKIVMGYDYVDFNTMNTMIRAMTDALNYGSQPNMFSFISPSQQLVLKARKIADNSLPGILGSNRDSILLGDNYTHHILLQCATHHGGQPKDFVTHPDVLASSPFVFLGLDNLPGPLVYTLMTMYGDNYSRYEGFIKELREEVSQVHTYSDVKKSGCLDKLYLETLRYVKDAKITTRLTSRETTCGGKTIPAGTVVVLSLGSILEDKRYWGEDAGIFNPNRKFPDGVDSTNVKQFPYIPFSVGIRSCPGYLITNVVMSAFFTAFFKGDYKVTWDPSNPHMSTIPLKDNLVKMPPAFKVNITV